jgi:hypothetical protein
MRFEKLLAVAAAALAMGLASPPDASAFDRDRPDVPAGWGKERDVRHWVYYPRYRHFYYTHGQTDPYAYQAEPRGYYPYYNSGYWKPRGDVALKRAHFVHPKYYKAWGANRKHWNNAGWHATKDGRIDHSHW